jgi:hypothetical protein
VAWLASAGPAAAVHGSGLFELDGNALSAGADDASTLFAGPGISFDHFFGQDALVVIGGKTYDVVYKSGAKDNSALSGTSATGEIVAECVYKQNPTDKLDLQWGFAGAYRVGGDVVAYFGATRDTSNGDAAVGLWLLQDAVSCTPVDTGTPGPWTGRKRHGDLLLVTNFTSGGAVQAADLYRWHDPTPLSPESGDEALVLVTSGTRSCTATGPDHHGLAPDFCATTNGTSIATAWQGPKDAGTYIEGGINLTQMFKNVLGQDVCYLTFMLESRASQSLSAQLEDVLLGSLQTCGSITVTKETTPAGASQSFDFTVAGGPASVVDTFPLADGDAHQTASVRPGTYTITEVAPPGWSLQGATCVGGPFGGGGVYTSGTPIVLDPGESIACTFTNVQSSPPPGAASITVDKITVPGGGPAFPFTVATGAGATVSAFSLADTDTSHTTLGLSAGTYVVAEATVAGWTLSGATCSGGPFPAGGTPYASGDVFTLAAGDSVTCTFTNVPSQPATSSITVDKITLPAGGALATRPFTFTVAGGPGIARTFALTDVGAPDVTAVPAGTYTVKEAPAGGFTRTAVCVGGPFGAVPRPYAGAPFALGAGEHVACTFTNTLRSTGGFCPNASTVKVTTPGPKGRWPGNLGMDVVVRADLGESIQDAVDHATDLNGDGYLLIGIQAKATAAAGGHTAQGLVIDRAYALPLGIVGCSVRMRDPTPFDAEPVVKITDAASSPDLFVMGIYPNGSGGPGWQVNGNGRTIYSSNAENNATGIIVTGNDNTVWLGYYLNNTGTAIQIVGNGNAIVGAQVWSNGGHGIQIVGDDNRLDTNKVGDLARPNGGDGIAVKGRGNVLYRNRAHNNLGDGIEVTGGTALRPNTLVQNSAGDRSVGNGGYGIFLFNDVGNGAADPIELSENTARSNALDGFRLAPTAIGHQLRRNTSGGNAMQDNGGCEFDVSLGNLDGTGNVANAARVRGSAGQFPIGCVGSP